MLLAPGSPKVIDFGIARAMSATSGNTRPDQMVGTVAYMAPERFDTDADVPVVTTAADVFAWGGVVTYAGTGKTPFYADSPTATAARILTKPPRLDGLSRPLRDLVAHALEKDPANRPSARELLDLLISGDRPVASAAALADQPALKAAAAEAQAVTGVALPDDSAPSTRVAAAALAPASALDIPPGLVGYSENAIVTVPIEAVPEGTLGGAPPAGRPRRQVLPALLAVLTVLIIAAGVALIGFLLRDRFGHTTAGGPSASAPAPAPESATTTPPPKRIDKLASAGLWQPTAQTDEGASCEFAGGLLIARRETAGTFRCRGPQDVMADLTVDVGVRLDTTASCAAIWFHFADKAFDGEPGGYQLRVCEKAAYLSVHSNDQVVLKDTLPLAKRIGIFAAPTRIRLHVAGSSVEVSQDGQRVGTLALTEPALSKGRVVLGVYNDETTSSGNGPFEVAFTDIKLWY